MSKFRLLLPTTFPLIFAACGQQPAVDNCGNGQLDQGEVCDDGNATAGDGCSAACRLETGFICINYLDQEPVSVCLTKSDYEAGQQQQETTDQTPDPGDDPDNEPTDTDTDITDNEPTDTDNTDTESTDTDNTDQEQEEITKTDTPEEDPEESGVITDLDTTDYEEEPPSSEGASCTMDYGFTYDVSVDQIASLLSWPRLTWDADWAATTAEPAMPYKAEQIAYPEEDPEAYYLLRYHRGNQKATTSLIMPSYTDSMPLFDRGADWVTNEERCYQYQQNQGINLSQDAAYDLYASIAGLTTGVTLNQTRGRRNVLGIRGAHPGQFFYNGNLPNRFNDTIVLFWIDDNGQKHVREFAATTDTGIQKSSSVSASSLNANRHYRYVNGLHKGYNALHVNESSYATRDDANNNAHIDNDRNGWLQPTTGDQDYDRTGSGHNIHYGKTSSLEKGPVSNWSAGCQVIPGMKSWTTFITNAWTGSGDAVDYYLVDVRDIDKRALDQNCTNSTTDGSHDCPFPITFKNGSFSTTGVLKAGGTTDFDYYNCATATNESGPEHVYFFTWDGSGSAKKSLTVSVSSSNGGDPDIHLLSGASNNACIIRKDKTFTKEITPGRYYIVVDTYVSNGTIKYGDYTLNVTLE